MKQGNRNCNRDNEMIKRQRKQRSRSKPSGNNQEKERQREMKEMIKIRKYQKRK